MPPKIRAALAAGVLSLFSLVGTVGFTNRADAALSSQSRAGALVIASASKYVGVGYKWGGGRAAGQERRGMDSSGFTYTTYRKLGIDVGVVTNTQERAGKYIGTNLSMARPGDLIMTGSTRNKASHVLIYYGFKNGKHLVLESVGMGSQCRADAPRYGANPWCAGIGKPHVFNDRRPIVNIRRIVCSVNSAGRAVPCLRPAPPRNPFTAHH